MISYSETPVQEIPLSFGGMRLLLKREDLNHPVVAGNKFWKLKHNLQFAIENGFNTLLTVGGAFSNHIFATAHAAKEVGLKSIGIIRGEKPEKLNHVLTSASAAGMKLHFVSRTAYKMRREVSWVRSLESEFGGFYFIPEGGTNTLAVRGCMEWAEKLQAIECDYVCMPVGTGGTMAGLSATLRQRQLVGYSILKDGAFLKDEVERLHAESSITATAPWAIETAYSFGGYAKVSDKLREFVSSFPVPLDEVYTGKMMYGIIDQIKSGRFIEGSTILALHTGGLQTTGRLKRS